MSRPSMNPSSCKYCGGPTFIKDTKQCSTYIMRYRECKKCFQTSTTYEITDAEMKKYAVQQKSINIILNQATALKES